eukprot:TRINITY_DN4255_c0_g1_i11.p1 TRINITY_DN4255_c0_g1~~TRINITY_DN4255_c0_g1_i11.p1  ORF type:complete len:227 (-),score=42.04 TRINITY_DN4255_c0_g1_i11:101-781(-)
MNGVMPVIEGVVQQHAVTQFRKGFDLTRYLASLLEDHGHYFTTFKKMEEVRKMKEKLCYVATDFNLEIKKPVQDVSRQYTMEDGSLLELGRERFKVPEMLFRPSIAQLGIEDTFGIPSLACQAILKCPIDYRLNLLGNIVLTGGTTLFPGFAQRLESEIWDILHSKMPGLKSTKIQTRTHVHQKYLPWKGASIFANIPQWLDQQAIWRESYDEIGADHLSQSRLYS